MTDTVNSDHHLPSGSDVDDLLQRAVAPALRRTRPDLSESLLDILAELLDNAMTHGDSPAGAELVLRADAGRVAASVTDHGIGIRAHLARAGIATDNDSKAIEAAAQEGTTGAYEPRGYGLSDSIRALTGLPGSSLTIRSGTGAVVFASRAEPSCSEAEATIRGTAVTVRAGPVEKSA